MTELEIMHRAKMYIDSLAQGIDPLTGSPVPENDVINNVRISRCLFYVSGVLGKVIENGGEVQKRILKKSEKAPFELTEEQLSILSADDMPEYISYIVNDINSLIDEEKMRKLSYRTVNEWLVQNGFLEIKTYNEKSFKRVTPEGMKLGITEIKRENEKGTFYVISYDRNARQFLIDNLPAIIEFAKQK